MKLDSETIQKRMSHFKKSLTLAGIKLTHQRLEIFREVAATDEHPDVETIFKGVRKRIPTISLDTVYRTLWLLFDLGIISTLGPPRGKTRFDANMNRHHHFVCVKCGMTRDFYSEEWNKLSIPDSVNKLGIVKNTHVELSGLCKNCSNTKN